MGEEVRIDLVSKADTSGFDAMGKASGTASAGMAGVSKESRDMAQNMGRGIEVGNATTALMQNLGNASKGGAEGMFAAARATASFAQVVKGVVAGAGHIGLAIAALGLLAGAAFALKDKFTKSGESAEEFKKRVDALNKAKLESIVGQLNDITAAADEGKAAIIAEAAEIDKMADAKLARDKAKVEADGALSPEEKQRRTTELTRAREDERINQTADTMDRKAGMDEAAAADIRTKADQLDIQTRIAQSARLEAEAAKREAQNALKALSGGFDSKGKLIPGFEDEAEAYKSASARQRALEARVPTAEAALAGDDGLEARSKAAKAAADKAAADAEKSRKAADDFKRQQSALGTITAETRGYEDKRDAAKIPLTPQQQAAQDLSDLKAKEILPSDWRGRIAARIPVDRAQLGRIYPGEVFGESPTKPQGAPSGGTIQTADGTKIKVDARPLEKGLKDSNDKTREAIDAELAKVAAGVAAQNMTLTSTIAATATIAAAQAATNAALEQLKSQVSNMRLK